MKKKTASEDGEELITPTRNARHWDQQSEISRVLESSREREVERGRERSREVERETPQRDYLPPGRVQGSCSPTLVSGELCNEP
jgi:hypothetical protein